MNIRMIMLFIALSSCSRVVSEVSKSNTAIIEKPVYKSYVDKAAFAYEAILSCTKKGKNTMVEAHVRVINKSTNQSPLRAVSGNLNDYNVLNEFLLNRNRENFALPIYGQSYLASAYFFENSYNAFPIENIKLEFEVGKVTNGEKLQLAYWDEVFAKQEILFIF